MRLWMLGLWAAFFVVFLSYFAEPFAVAILTVWSLLHMAGLA